MEPTKNHECARVRIFGLGAAVADFNTIEDAITALTHRGTRFELNLLRCLCCDLMPEEQELVDPPR